VIIVNGVEILLIVAVGIAVSAAARRRGIEPGLVIVVLAAAASFVPGVPRLELESELILAIVVPPLLYSAARGAAVTNLGANIRPILTLGVLLVVLTAGALGVLSSWLLPSIGLAAAFVLGSVLAPPDTITTVSHGDEIGLPKRVTSILTGESLVNDATALTLFTIAVAAVGGEQATWSGGIVRFLYNAIAGAIIGGLFGVATLWVRKRLGNATLETALVLLVPFTAFLVAEEAGASGILAVVVASVSISVNITMDPRHQYPGAYRTRLQEGAVWPVVDFLLETFVFAYIGLQLKFVLEELASSAEPGLVRTLVAAGVLLVAAIVLRIVAVAGLFGRWTLKLHLLSRRLEHNEALRKRYATRLERQSRRGRRPFEPPTGKETLLVGWIGMRGILTLAAAAAVPATTPSGEEFPGRDAVQAIALIVTLGTLLIQGTTLKRLIRALGIDPASEAATAAERRATAAGIVAATDPDDYPAQRTALGRAVAERRLDEQTARGMIEEIDLRQAADDTRQ